MHHLYVAGKAIEDDAVIVLNIMLGGTAWHRGSILASRLAAPGSTPILASEIFLYCLARVQSRLNPSSAHAKGFEYTEDLSLVLQKI